MAVMTELSSASFVYPFRYEAARFDALRRQVDAATVRRLDDEVAVWEEASLPADDLLPHATDLFGARPSGAGLWRLRGAAREAFGAADEVHWALHLKGRALPFRLGADGPRSEGLHGGGALLALFDGGVGFLTVSASPRATDLGAWLDFLHYFRFVEEPRARPMSARVDEAPFTPPGGPQNEEYRFADVIAALLRTVDPEAWWRPVGRLIPFSALFLDGEPVERQGTTLYQLRNCFHRNLGRHPSEADLDSGNASLLPYALRQWFVTSVEGTAFVAFDAPDDAFFRRRLPLELSEVYFLVFLLALYQRLRLTGLAEGTDVDDLPHDLLSYATCGHLSQVAQDELPQRLYERLRAVFGVDPLFEEVSARARGLQAIQEAHRSAEMREGLAALIAAAERQRSSFEQHREALAEHVDRAMAQGQEIGGQLERLTDRVKVLGERLEGSAEQAAEQGSALGERIAAQGTALGERIAETGKELLVELVTAMEKGSAEQAGRSDEQMKQLVEHFAAQTKLFEEQASRFADQMKLLGEQNAEQASRHAEQMKLLVEQGAEQASRHAEQMKLLAEQGAEQAGRHAEQVKQLSEQMAALADRHAEQVRLLGEQHAERRAQTRGLDRKMGYLALLIGVPVLVTNFLGINLSGWTSKTDGISLGEALGCTVAALLVGWALLWWIDGRSDPPKARD